MKPSNEDRKTETVKEVIKQGNTHEKHNHTRIYILWKHSRELILHDEPAQNKRGRRKSNEQAQGKVQKEIPERPHSHGQIHNERSDANRKRKNNAH